MATVVNSFALDGVNAYPVIVETVTLHGQPSVNIVGLGDTAVKEAAHRLEAALSCGSFEFPRLKVVINLAPSGVKKSGSHFDLAMAVSLLHEAGQMLAIKENFWRLRSSASFRLMLNCDQSVVYCRWLLRQESVA